MHFLIVVASLLASTFAAPSFEERMIGGQNAERAKYPYQASLQYKSGGIVFSHVCGAIIISPNWVLTAAQCKDSFDLSRYRVVAGLLTQGQNDGDVQTRGIEEFIPHRLYHGGVDTNDIALLLLSSPFDWTDTVQPVKLPSGGDPSGEATLTSWGSGSVLQVATLPLISHDECAEAIVNSKGSAEPFDDSQICTGPLSGEKGGCADDLGGALVQDHAVIGLLSWTPAVCGTKGVPAVYTRIDSHKDFIHEFVDDLP